MDIKKSTKKCGGKREGSGRKKATNPKVKVWFSVVQSQEQAFRDKVKPILDKLNKKGAV